MELKKGIDEFLCCPDLEICKKGGENKKRHTRCLRCHFDISIEIFIETAKEQEKKKRENEDPNLFTPILLIEFWFLCRLVHDKV